VGHGHIRHTIIISRLFLTLSPSRPNVQGRGDGTRDVQEGGRHDQGDDGMTLEPELLIPVGGFLVGQKLPISPQRDSLPPNLGDESDSNSNNHTQTPQVQDGSRAIAAANSARDCTPDLRAARPMRVARCPTNGWCVVCWCVTQTLYVIGPQVRGVSYYRTYYCCY